MKGIFLFFIKSGFRNFLFRKWVHFCNMKTEITPCFRLDDPVANAILRKNFPEHIWEIERNKDSAITYQNKRGAELDDLLRAMFAAREPYDKSSGLQRSRLAVVESLEALGILKDLLRMAEYAHGLECKLRFSQVHVCALKTDTLKTS